MQHPVMTEQFKKTPLRRGLLLSQDYSKSICPSSMPSQKVCILTGRVGLERVVNLHSPAFNAYSLLPIFNT